MKLADMKLAVNGTARVYPTEVVVVTGTTQTGRTTRIILTEKTSNILRKTYVLAETEGIHLGHAYWHVTEDRPAPCETCHHTLLPTEVRGGKV